jgi:hypothetical protein
MAISARLVFWFKRATVPALWWCLLLSPACGAAAASTSQPAPSQKEGLDASWDRARARSALETDFAVKHPHKGEKTLVYVRSLKNEGFKCRLQQRSILATTIKSEVGLERKYEGGIECVRDPYGSSACISFRVSLAIAGVDTQLPVNRLLRVLGDSTIRDGYFICEQKVLPTHEKRRLANAVKNGLAVPL